MPKQDPDITEPANSNDGEVPATECASPAHDQDVDAIPSAPLTPELESLFAAIRAKTEAANKRRIVAEAIQTLTQEIEADMQTVENPRDFSQYSTPLLLRRLKAIDTRYLSDKFTRTTCIGAIHELFKRLETLNQHQKYRFFLKCSKYFKYTNPQGALNCFEIIINDEELFAICPKEKFLQKLEELKVKVTLTEQQ